MGAGVGEAFPGAGAGGISGGLAPAFDFGPEVVEGFLVWGLGGDVLDLSGVGGEVIELFGGAFRESQGEGWLGLLGENVALVRDSWPSPYSPTAQ